MRLKRRVAANVRFGAVVVLCLLITTVDFFSYFMSMLSDGVFSLGILSIIWDVLKVEKEDDPNG